VTRSQNSKPSTDSDKALLKRLIEDYYDQQSEIQYLKQIVHTGEVHIQSLERLVRSDEAVLNETNRLLAAQKDLAQSLNEKIKDLEQKLSIQSALVRLQTKRAEAAEKEVIRLERQARWRKILGYFKTGGTAIAGATAGYFLSKAIK